MNSLDRFLYKFLRYGLLLAVFVPLVVFRNAFSPFNFGKVIVFRTLVEVLLVAYVILAVKYRELRPPVFSIKYLVSSIKRKILRIKSAEFQTLNTNCLIPNTIFLALALFTASMAVSTFLGVNWHQSFWGYWERMGGLFSWLHYYAFFIMAISVFRSKSDWMIVLWFSVFAALISTFYGFIQKFVFPPVLGASGRFRILGTLGNPAAFAGYLLFNFYFALYLFAESKGRKVKVFLFVSCLLFFIAILMTAVRGAALAMAVGILYLVFSILYTKLKILNSKFKKVAAALVLIIALLGGGYFLLRSDFVRQSQTLGRLANFSFDQPTIQQRLLVWKIALSGIFSGPPERFFFGWGPENFSALFSEHYDPQLFNSPNDVIFDRAHNLFLDITANQGIVGLIVFIFLWAVIIVRIEKSEIQNSKFVFFALILSYFIHSFFFFDLSSHYIMLMVLFGSVFTLSGILPLHSKNICSQSVKTGEEAEGTQSRKPFSLLIMIIAAVGLVLLVIFVNVRPALANFYSTRGFVLFSRGGGEEGLKYFKEAQKNAGWSARDVNRKFAESYIDFLFRDSKILRGEEGKAALGDLINWFEKQVDRNPLDYSEYIYLYKTQRAGFLLAGEFESEKHSAEILLKRGIERLPREPFLRFEFYDFLMGRERFGEAAEVMKQVLAIREIPRAKFNLGLALALAGLEGSKEENGKLEEGISHILEAVDGNYYPAAEVNFLGKKLEEKKKYKEMAVLYSKLSSKEPQYFVHLSYAHLLLNDRKNAAAFADRAMAFGYDRIGGRGFKILSEIYRLLGDNKKRSEALLKSIP